MKYKGELYYKGYVLKYTQHNRYITGSCVEIGLFMADEDILHAEKGFQETVDCIISAINCDEMRFYANRNWRLL